VGIGAVLSSAPDGLELRRVMPDTPAADAALAAGDVVLEIDGTVLKGMSIEDAIQRIRGPEGSVVTLRVRRAGGAVEEIPLTRRPVSGPSRP
jgi:carboxyl-terminal processing protease